MLYSSKKIKKNKDKCDPNNNKTIKYYFIQK